MRDMSVFVTCILSAREMVHIGLRPEGAKKGDNSKRDEQRTRAGAYTTLPIRKLIAMTSFAT